MTDENHCGRQKAIKTPLQHSKPGITAENLPFLLNVDHSSSLPNQLGWCIGSRVSKRLENRTPYWKDVRMFIP